MDTERKAFAARTVAIGILLFSGRGPAKPVKIIVSTGAGGIVQ